MRNPIFAKREVRQAMFFAVDRTLIAKTVYFGYARPGTGPIASPNTTFFTSDTFSTTFDPRKAAALLDAAGYPKKAGGKRFTLNLLAAGWFAENGKAGAIVKQGLEDVGVGVNLTVPDRATSIRRLYTDYDFDLAIANKAAGSEPVPSTTQYYTSDGIRKGVPFRNASGFHTDEVDALVDKIKVETDPAKRKALVAEFQKIATVECADLPLVELESITLASTRVRNHSNDPAFPAASWHDIWLAG
jgi:peptide/nickel transport system substrate-binding protein